MAINEIRMPELLRRITLQVRVTGQREASIRIWLGVRLLMLAARVMGCGLDVEAATPSRSASPEPS